jgi:hypothetical protein
VMDNLSSHNDAPRAHRSGGREAALSPAQQPRLQSDRERLRQSLRKATERTVDGLWTAIGRTLDRFTPPECANYFAAAGYDAIPYRGDSNAASCSRRGAAS